MLLLEESNSNLIKAVFLFEIGRDKETKKALAQSLANILKKSTLRKDNLELQEAIDFYGASIDIYASPLYMTAELHCLAPHFNIMIDLLCEILFEANFTENEWLVTKKITQESISQNEMQTEFWADKLISESILGSESIYGYYSTSIDYDKIVLQDIKDFYSNFIQRSSPKIFLAGEVNSTSLKYIQAKLSEYKTTETSRILPQIDPIKTSDTIIKKLESGQQSSIRMGILVPRFTFEDFICLEVLNTFLGGYFLSELMKKLRIELGLTYGVYSHCVHFENTSLLIISFETDTENINPSFNAIIELFNRLKLETKSPLTEAIKQYYGQWSKNSERTIQELSYHTKLYKLGYNYDDYKESLESLWSEKLKLNSRIIDTYKFSLLNFENYMKVIVH